MISLVFGAALVFLRLLGFIVSAPVLNNKQLPVALKVLMAALLTGVMLPMLEAPNLTPTLGTMVAAGLWELLLGLGLGTVTNFTVATAATAGTIADYQMGFGNSGMLNPAGDQSQPMMASFYQVLMVLVALATNLHLALTRILLESFYWLPCGLPDTRHARLLGVIAESAGNFFMASVWLALPVTIGLLSVEVAVAFLSRLLPQMNMLIAAAPVRVLAGLVLVSLSLPLTTEVMARVLQGGIDILGGLRV